MLRLTRFPGYLWEHDGKSNKIFNQTKLRKLIEEDQRSERNIYVSDDGANPNVTEFIPQSQEVHFVV